MKVLLEHSEKDEGFTILSLLKETGACNPNVKTKARLNSDTAYKRFERWLKKFRDHGLIEESKQEGTFAGYLYRLTDKGIKHLQGVV